jgi:phosphopantothenoylcysteine synthetase/decarboxylase
MKKIILGITGSIAAYRACDLVRLFVKGGYSVVPVMTLHAQRLITPLTLETLSGNPVHTDATAWQDRRMDHLGLRDNASLFLVAPASADIIGKFAAGIADDLLSTTYLSVECPVVIAPAMNPAMYRHPAVRANMELLGSRGAIFVEPGEGTVACGDEGRGRLADINLIYEAAVNAIKG